MDINIDGKGKQTLILVTYAIYPRLKPKMTSFDKYNPFNSAKTLIHVEYWKPIVETHTVPPPRFVSIDPCSFCDYACPFCNSSIEIHKKAPVKMMSIEMVVQMMSILQTWKTRSVCIGGGGESLLNPNTSYIIGTAKDLGMNVGLVTNGTHIHNHIEALKRMEWVGISMDAGTKETYSKMKGTTKDNWNQVLKNITLLVGGKVEVTYKFLLHPDNYKEIYQAAAMAKGLGCNVFHLRPGSHPWFHPTDKSFQFGEDVIRHCKEQIEKAKADLDCDTFKIRSITDKFNDQWGIKKSFSKCYAIFTTCFITAEGNIGLCCDRRGDNHIMLGNLDNIMEKWGSEDHWKIHNNIKVNECPRCTLTHVNEIFENVIFEDKMLYNMY